MFKRIVATSQSMKHNSDMVSNYSRWMEMLNNLMSDINDEYNNLKVDAINNETVETKFLYGFVRTLVETGTDFMYMIGRENRYDYYDL